VQVISTDEALRARIERALAGPSPCPLIVTAEVAALAALRAAHPATALVVVGVRRAQIAAALDAGADAVLSGALRPAELRAHVHALARRQARPVLGPLVLDRGRAAVDLDGAALALPPRELALLRCLASSPGRVFTKDELLARCWPGARSAPRSRTLERHVARLRRRLGRHGTMLVTVWGVGYRLDAPA
jgi:DNA-binding response OmpR family regulator